MAKTTTSQKAKTVGKPTVQKSSKTLRSVQHRNRSTAEQLARIRAGELETRIKGYYDNIKEFDKNVAQFDLSRMNRLQLLAEEARLLEIINTHTPTKADAQQDT